MQRGSRVPPRTLRAAFRAYLDLGSLTAAAAAVDVHPKTLARYARKENWQHRRAKIERAAADRADAGEIEALATARLTARYKWTQALSSPGAREGILALLREIVRHEKN